MSWWAFSRSMANDPAHAAVNSTSLDLTAALLDPVLDDILSTDTNYVACNVETNQAAFVEQVSRTHPHVKIRVNLDPGVVACHDPRRIYRTVDHVLEIVGPRSNCVMGTGALPLEPPP